VIYLGVVCRFELTRGLFDARRRFKSLTQQRDHAVAVLHRGKEVFDFSGESPDACAEIM